MLTYHRSVGIIRITYLENNLLAWIQVYTENLYGGFSEFISFTGISSQTKSIVPPLLLLQSRRKGVLKTSILNWPKMNLSSINASETTFHKFNHKFKFIPC